MFEKLKGAKEKFQNYLERVEKKQQYKDYKRMEKLRKKRKRLEAKAGWIRSEDTERERIRKAEQVMQRRRKPRKSNALGFFKTPEELFGCPKPRTKYKKKKKRQQPFDLSKMF